MNLRASSKTKSMISKQKQAKQPVRSDDDRLKNKRNTKIEGGSDWKELHSTVVNLTQILDVPLSELVTLVGEYHPILCKMEPFLDMSKGDL